MKLKRNSSLLVTVAVVIATVFFFDTSYAAEHVIEIQNFKYLPEQIEAQPGDVIVWINRDIVPHTATADDSSWDTGQIASGESKKIVLSTAYSRSYYCVYHPSMRGSL